MSQSDTTQIRPERRQSLDGFMVQSGEPHGLCLPARFHSAYYCILVSDATLLNIFRTPHAMAELRL